MKNLRSKRVDIVSIKMCKESSILYEPRTITSPFDGVKLLRPFLENQDREQFIVVCLDSKCQPTAIHVCIIGTLNTSLVHPREVFKVAILSNASSILIAHNHPSGDPEPSNEDVQITKRINEAGNIMGIKLVDHIIIGDNGRYVSMKEKRIF